MVGSARDLGVEFLHTAATNPIVGAVAAIESLDIGYRTRILSPLAYAAGLATIVAIEVGNVAANLGQAISNDIGAIGQLMPSWSKSTSAAPIADITATAPNQNQSRGKVSDVGLPLTEVKPTSKGYVPE